MDSLTLLYVAGALQLVVVAANFVIPGRLDFAGNLSKTSPIVGQIFRVHHVYIVGILAFFAALCFLFPAELAGGSALGRFTTGFIALFWGLRLPVQLFYYDPNVRRANRVEDVLFGALLGALALLFLIVFSRGFHGTLNGVGFCLCGMLGLRRKS